jgi:DNA-binding MltR family transcriptional regulator
MMPTPKDQNELDAYYLAHPTHPRAAGVMWAAIVERKVDKLFSIGLRPDQSVHNELFQPSGALGNYAVKVKLAYLLGWIGKEVYDDLTLLARIRNRFAHALEAKDFSDERINAWLGNMHVYQLIPGVVSGLRERASADPSPTTQAAAFTAEQLLDSDNVSAFRFCVDLIVHHLEQCGNNMAKNLAGLPGNWLVLPSEDPAEQL